MSLSNVDKTVLDKAAVDEGFAIAAEHEGNWLAYDTMGLPYSIRLTKAGGRYLVGINHHGASRELEKSWSRWSSQPDLSAPLGFYVFQVEDSEPLHRLVRQMWSLARVLPTEPLRRFEMETRNLPLTTEVERMTVLRIGQDIFRESLMEYWDRRCAVTGLQEPRLLIASHIKPWKDCDTDAERLDVYNGLLLAAHLDKAFDAGLISFADDGHILFATTFTPSDRNLLGLHPAMRLTRISDSHVEQLRWHRATYGIIATPDP